MSPVLRGRWQRLRPWLRPLRSLERPVNDHGLRLAALEALERGLFREAHLLALASVYLPPEVLPHLLRLPLREAASRVSLVLEDPAFPKRPPLPRHAWQEEVFAPILSLLLAGEALGAFRSPMDRLRRLLYTLEEPEARLVQSFLQGAALAFPEPSADLFPALEDLLHLARALKPRGV